MQSKRRPQTFSFGDVEMDYLRQLAELAHEPMSAVLRRLVKEEASKLKLKLTPPDPLADVPAHIKSGDRMDILHSLNRGLTFDQARHAAGFNPDWTIRDD